MVELRQICHSYTGKSAAQPVLSGVDLTVEEGEFLAVMGPFGYIMQDFALVSDYTVFQNVEIPLLYGTAVKAAERRRRILEALERVGLQHKQNAYAATLSGGEKQRTAIARALVNAPKVLLADEPTGSLDQKNGQMVMDLLLGLQKEGRTIVMVMHNPQLAEQCSRVVFVKDGIVKAEG